MSDVLDVPNDEPSEVVEVVPVDEVLSALDAYANSNDSASSQGLEDVSAQLDDLRTSVRALGDGAGKDATYVVSLSDEQWETARECWVWAKGGLSVSVFLLVLVLLVLSAVLGSRLWDTFAAGWRHG